jgi:hypothetical protein
MARAGSAKLESMMMEIYPGLGYNPEHPEDEPN